MKILKLNQMKLDRIIKEEDLILIESAEKYADALKKEAKRQVNEAVLEAENIKNQAYKQTVDQLTVENQNALETLKNGLEQFLQNLNTDIYNLVYRILVKMGLNETNPHNMHKIIRNELSQNALTEIIKITAHEHALEFIKKDLDAIHIQQVIWEINNDLLLDECICTTKLWTLRINIEYFRANLFKDLLNFRGASSSQG